LEPERLILLGASPTRSREAEREAIDTLGIKVIAEADVAADPQNATAGALALIGNAPYALHFDSDCIDFADLPICENTDRNVGLPHQTAFQALTYAAAGPAIRAITITQITPYHGAADGSTINTFTHGLATTLINATADRGQGSPGPRQSHFLAEHDRLQGSGGLAGVEAQRSAARAPISGTE
jgi:arginase